MSNPASDKIAGIKLWWVASRPFSLSASSAPVIFGGTAAVCVAGATLHPVNFALAVIGMMLLQAGSNVLNDVYDFNKGLDREVLPVSGAVVRRYITPEEGLKLAAVFLLLGCLIGLWLAYQVTPFILLLGVIGVAVGVFYSAGSWALKYHAFGDLAVFLNFGIFGTLGGWVVQSGSFSWLPVAWGVPLGFLIIAILHANNWRDIGSDSAGGFRSVASLLGDAGSERYYRFLILSPYFLTVAFILVPRLCVWGAPMPGTALIVFLSLPAARKLLKKAAQRKDPVHPLDFVTLDGATGQLSLLFGALGTAALIIAYFT